MAEEQSPQFFENLVFWWIGSVIFFILKNWGVYTMVGLFTFWDVNLDMQHGVMELFFPLGMQGFDYGGMMKMTDK